MIEFLIILFLILVVYVGIIPNPNYHKQVFVLLAGVLIVTAGLRAEGLTYDYDNYINAYNYYIDSRMEPAFLLIAGFVKSTFNNPIFLFIIYALIGVSLKFIAMKQLTKLYLLSAILYLSMFFLLHEMTQIRAGVASGILLLCIKPLHDRNFKKFLILVSLAVCFHYSSLVILPLWFLKVNSIKRNIYLSLIPLAYLLALSGITLGFLIELIPFEPIQFLYESRNNEMEIGIGDNINIFNSLQLLRCVIALVLIYNIEKLTSVNKYSTLLIKIYTISLMVIPLFMDLPVVSFRVSELLSIVEIILIPLSIYLFKLKKAALIFPLGIAGVMLWISLFYIKLIIISN